MDYLLAVRAWVKAVERVANTGHAVGLTADPHDPVSWVIANEAEAATAVVLEAAEGVWAQ